MIHIFELNYHHLLMLSLVTFVFTFFLSIMH